MNFDFGEVLARAGRITWKYKSLWWAGVVMSLVSLVPGLLNLGFSPAIFSFSDPSEMNRQMPTILLLDAGIICLSFLSIPVYALMMTVPSLGTLQVEQGQQALKFGQVLRDSLRYFWRILGLYLLVVLISVVAVMVVFGCLALLSIPTMGLAMLCMFPLILLFIPVGIVVFALMEQGLAAVVVDDLRLAQALQRAWELLKKNIWVMVLISLIIYLGSLVVGMVLSVPLMVPMFASMFKIISSGGEPTPQMMVGLYRNMMWWMLAFSPLYAILQGVLMVFMQSVWTLTYLRLTKPRDNAPVVLEANA